MTDINALANHFLAELFRKEAKGIDEKEFFSKLGKICNDFKIEFLGKEFEEAVEVLEGLMDDPNSPLINNENKLEIHKIALENFKKRYPTIGKSIEIVKDGILIDGEVFEDLKTKLPADIVAEITKKAVARAEKEDELGENHLLISLEENLGVSFFRFLPGLVKHRFTTLPDNQKSTYLNLLINGLQAKNPGITNTSFPKYFFKNIVDDNNYNNPSEYFDFLHAIAINKRAPDDSELLAKAILTDLLMALGYPQEEVDINGCSIEIEGSKISAIHKVYDADWIDWNRTLENFKDFEMFRKRQSFFSYKFQEVIAEQLGVSFLAYLPVVIVERTRNMSLEKTMVYLSVLFTGIQSKYPDFAEEFLSDRLLDLIIGSKDRVSEKTMRGVKDLELSEVNRLIPVVLHDLLLASCHQPTVPSNTMLAMSRREINTLQKIWQHPEINFAEMLVDFDARV